MNKYNNLTIYQVKTELNDVAHAKVIHANTDIEAVRTWLREFVATNNTFISYRQIAERFLMWSMNHNIQFNQIKREDIKDYEEFLQDPQPHDYWCGVAKPRTHEAWKPFVRGLAPSSVWLNLRVLSTLFNYLVQSGYLLSNPFALYKRKDAQIVSNKGVDRYLTHKEWQYILDYIENQPKATVPQQQNYERTRWLFTLLYLTGCRRSEIAKAKMSDFLNRHDNWWLRVIGKGSKYGEVPITNDLLTALMRYRRFLKLPDFPNASETRIPLVCSVRAKDNSYVALSDSMLYKLIKLTCKNVAESIKETDPAAAFVIEQVSTHWLRHTSATHQVDAGIDIRVVKENLRHSMLETTMKYQHTEADKRHLETNQKFSIKK